MGVSEEEILKDLTEILTGLTDWEYPGPITRETRFFADLGFESIDAVALGERIEGHFGRRFPWNEFYLIALGEFQMGELVDYLRRHLDDSTGQGRSGGAE